MKYVRGQHPNSLRNLKPPFQKGHSANPSGWNGIPWLSKILEAGLAKAIARDIHREGLPATPELVAAVFARTIFPNQSEKQRLRIVKKLLPIFEQAMREHEPGDVSSARELRLM